MKAIRARLAALVASLIVATLASWGVRDLSPEGRALIEVWVGHTFELVLFLGYAVVHPWLQKRWNPTGAMTGGAARRLERLAHLDEER